jgi:DNA-binding NtrC family response regulator
MKQRMKILVVDDQRSARRLVLQILARLDDVDVAEASSIVGALAAVAADPPHLVLLDIRLATSPRDQSGLDLLRKLRARVPAPHVVMVTASSEIGAIREAMRSGASDYVLKDELSPELLLPIVQGIRERIALRGEVSRLRARVDRSQGVAAIVGSSEVMDRVRAVVKRVADADATVLIRGETGTGKELVARAIHELSWRRDQPFIAINCSALPHALMESLIFGHERGAFTGAVTRTKGQLELAGTGTVLLDEIAEMPLDVQAKLLRVLEDRSFRPLGATTETTLSARLLVATHADLERRIHEGRFREDLFFRINVVAIPLPPIAERAGDIPELVHSFASELPRKLRFSEDALAWLSRRRWPGNVRQLRNVIERVSILAEQDLVTPETLEVLAAERPFTDVMAEVERLVAVLLSLPAEKGSKIDLFERAIIQQALQLCGGVKVHAARLIGIDRKALTRRWRDLGEAVEADDSDDHDEEEEDDGQ